MYLLTLAGIGTASPEATIIPTCSKPESAPVQPSCSLDSIRRTAHKRIRWLRCPHPRCHKLQVLVRNVRYSRFGEKPGVF